MKVEIEVSVNGVIISETTIETKDAQIVYRIIGSDGKIIKRVEL